MSLVSIESAKVSLAPVSELTGDGTLGLASDATDANLPNGDGLYRLVATRSGGGPDSGQRVAGITMRRRTLRLDREVSHDAFLMGDLWVHPQLRGYSPPVHLDMIALAIVHLLWTEVDDRGHGGIHFRVAPGAGRLRDDLRILRAVLQPDRRTNALLDRVGDYDRTLGVAEYWQVTPETTRMCARAVQARHMRRRPRIELHDGRLVRELSLQADMPWLDVGSSAIDELAHAGWIGRSIFEREVAPDQDREGRGGHADGDDGL